MDWTMTTTKELLTSAMPEVNASHVFVRYTWTEFLDVHRPVILFIDRFITPIFYLIGVIGNLLSANIWLKKKMRRNNSSAIYLATLSVTDMLFLVLHILQELKYAWGYNTLSFPGVCEAYFLFYLCAQYLSPLLVLGFTIERWIAVCKPFSKERYCTAQRAVRVVTGLIVGSLALCSAQAYFWTYDSGECQIRQVVSHGGDASIWSIYTWVTEMLIFLLVPLVMLVFNVLVIREIRRISNRGKSQLGGQLGTNPNTSAATTVMLLSVSFYVISTTLPATLVYVLAPEFPEGNPHLTDLAIQKDSSWQKYFSYITLRKVIEEICLSHYACNFFLYLITGTQFRHSLQEICKCRLGEERRNDTTYLEVSRTLSKPCVSNNHRMI